MCGIFGYIGHRNASSLLVKGLLRLEYRGYDSSGVVVKNGQLQSYKDIGKISEMATSLPDIKGSMGIAHTRWATHGGVTKENAHPRAFLKSQVVILSRLTPGGRAAQAGRSLLFPPRNSWCVHCCTHRSFT